MMLDSAVSKALGSLSASCRVIEIGCGLQGRFTRVLSARFADLTAVDPALSVRRIAHLRADPGLCNVRFLPVSIEAMPLKAERFDLAVMAYAIHHVAPTARPKLLDAVSRMLYPNGQFLLIEDIDVPCSDIRQRSFQDYHKALIALDRAVGRPHFSLLRPDQLLATFESNGWQVRCWKIINKPRPLETAPEVLSVSLLDVWQRSRPRAIGHELPKDIPELCQQLVMAGVATPPYILLTATTNRR